MRTRQAYADFLRRNGQPGNATVAMIGENQGTQKSTNGSSSRTVSVGAATVNVQESSVEALSSAEAVRMTEKVLAYLKAQNQHELDNQAEVERICDQLHRVQSLNSDLARRITDLKTSLDATDARRLELEAKLTQADERIKVLEAEKGEVERDLKQIQGMFDYNSGQKAAAFKDKLVSDLYILRQFTKEDLSHFNDAERAEAYQAVIEETVSVLLRHGIDIGEG